MAIDITKAVRPYQETWTAIIPNRTEYLISPRKRAMKARRLRRRCTLVMMTTFSLGMLWTLSAFPRIRSDSPFEYMFAVSKVLMPLSYLCVISVNIRRT